MLDSDGGYESRKIIQIASDAISMQGVLLHAPD